MTILEQIDALTQERTRIHEEIAPKQQRLAQIHDELAPLQEEHSRTWIREMGDSPDWPMIIRLPGSNSPLSSVALIHYVEKHLRQSFGMYGGGYWQETQEASFQLMLTRGNDESLEKNLKGVKFFTPLLTPHKDGYVYFGIFEHSLSSGGSYVLQVRPDFSEAGVARGQYGTKIRFKDVRLAILYVQEHLWYDDPADLNSD